MRYLIIRLIINAICLYIATRIVPGLTIDQSWTTIAIVAFIFGLVNAMVRPILEFLTCPLQILTLGLFTFVINAIMLELTAWVVDHLNMFFQINAMFQVNDFVAAFLGALVITLVSFVLTLVVREAGE